jgi:hypothetical protein
MIVKNGRNLGACADSESAQKDRQQENDEL